MTRIYAGTAIALIAVLLGATGYMILTGSASDDKYAECRATNVSGAGAIGGPFTLVDSQGRTVTDKEVFTKPSLLYFGYTFCPDVCPFDNARNAEAIDILDELGIDAQPVFVTIDPERDTPGVMGDYAANMSEKMIGLSGSPEQVAAAARAYRVYSKKNDSEDPDDYLMDHSTFTYLVLPEDGFVEFYNRDATADDIAQSAACFVEKSG